MQKDGMKANSLKPRIIVATHKSTVWRGLYHNEKKPQENIPVGRMKLSQRTRRFPYEQLELVAEVDGFRQIKKNTV